MADKPRAPALSGRKEQRHREAFAYVDGSRSAPIAGAQMAIYQVASSRQVRGGGAVYMATPAGASAGIQFEGMTAAASNRRRPNRRYWRAKPRAAVNPRMPVVRRGLPALIRTPFGDATGARARARGYEMLAPYLIMAPAVVQTDSGNSWQYQVVSLPQKPDVVLQDGAAAGQSAENLTVRRNPTVKTGTPGHRRRCKPPRWMAAVAVLMAVDWRRQKRLTKEEQPTIE